jgi:hypothetical protein
VDAIKRLQDLCNMLVVVPGEDGLSKEAQVRAEKRRGPLNP